MSEHIRLIVGLGNPGPTHINDRHNAGFWFAEALALHYKAEFKVWSKHQALIAELTINNQPMHILTPMTYMNKSGHAVRSFASFFKIEPQEILVAHDELDLSPGDTRLKLDGGHGGHNGLRDIFATLGSKQFYRLRIGIGHPGHKDLVSDYVLNKPSVSDKTAIINSFDAALRAMPELVNGSIDKGMQNLNTRS